MTVEAYVTKSTKAQGVPLLLRDKRMLRDVAAML
jgi:hypothetical protein